MRWFCLALVLIAAAWAQSAADRPTFEVASVKPSAETAPRFYVSGRPGSHDPGRYTASVPFSYLIFVAYDVQDEAGVSMPEWMQTAWYDVAAKLPPGTTKEQFRQMLQNLLADRFHVQVHHETRVFALRVIKTRSAYRISKLERSRGTPSAGRM